jgi:hypothetical protein
MASDTKFECPLNQYLLADALGLTVIHVNRVLRQLREVGLISLKSHHVVIDDEIGYPSIPVKNAPPAARLGALFVCAV